MEPPSGFEPRTPRLENQRPKKINLFRYNVLPSQQTFACSNLVIKTLEKSVEYVQS